MTARRTVLAAVGIFLVTRFCALAWIFVQARGTDRSFLDLLTKADGQWYLQIAAGGYAPPPAIGPDGSYVEQTSLAFFPLYPATIKVFSWAIDPRAAAVLAAVVAGVVAAGLMALWARTTVGTTGALAVVAIWSLWPSNVVLSMGYSEALFTAATVGCLLALQRRAFVWAAFACTLAGLTRPTGAALLVAVVVGLVVRRPPMRTFVPALLLAPLGLLLSLGHVALATGRWDGWFWLERTVWRSGFDLGRGTLSSTVAALTGGFGSGVPTYVVSAVVCIVSVVLLVVLLLRRPPIEEAVFAVLATGMALGGVAYFHCKPRFLGVVTPLFLAPAAALARLPRWALVLVGLVALGLSTWWAGYLVTVWPRSI